MLQFNTSVHKIGDYCTSGLDPACRVRRALGGCASPVDALVAVQECHSHVAGTSSSERRRLSFILLAPRTLLSTCAQCQPSLRFAGCKGNQIITDRTAAKYMGNLKDITCISNWSKMRLCSSAWRSMSGFTNSQYTMRADILTGTAT